MKNLFRFTFLAALQCCLLQTFGCSIVANSDSDSFVDSSRSSADLSFEEGLQYFVGNSLQQDYSKSFHLFRDAAYRGSVESYGYLAWHYINGAGTSVDLERARYWYEKSALAGDVESMFIVAQMAEEESPVAQEIPVEAQTWYKKAAARGHAESQYIVGAAYLKKGGDKNLDAAEHWLIKSSEQNKTEAQFTLGMAYKTGELGRVDSVSAMKWLKSAAQSGSTEAQYELAILLQISSDVISHKQAYIWLTRAALEGHSPSQYELAVLKLKGSTIVKKNSLQAVELLSSAAENNYRPAQCLLGKLYYEGNGVRQDFGVANSWFNKASDGRNKIASPVPGLMRSGCQKIG